MNKELEEELVNLAIKDLKGVVLDCLEDLEEVIKGGMEEDHLSFQEAGHKFLNYLEIKIERHLDEVEEEVY